MIGKDDNQKIDIIVCQDHSDDYILKYHTVEPKVAKKYIEIAKSFGSKIQEDRVLMEPVEQIWVEKLLCESDKNTIYGVI